MGRKFWLRVAGGAFFIFLIGFALFSAGRMAKNEAGAAIAQFATELGGKVPAVLAGMRDSLTLSLDGQRLGQLRHLKIERQVQGELPQLAALVQLDQGVESRRVATCDFVPVSGKDLHKFRCAAAGEGGLEKVGTIRFEGPGLMRPLLVSDSMAAELRKGDPYHVDVDLTKETETVVRAGKGSDQLVQIKADSHGAHIVVNDKQGKKVVRMKADSTGFSLSVDSARAK